MGIDPQQLTHAPDYLFANGALSCPGAGTLSERFGGGSLAGNDALAVGRGADAGAECVALGRGAVVAGAGVGIGRLIDVNGGVGIGRNSTIVAGIGIGNGISQNATFGDVATSIGNNIDNQYSSICFGEDSYSTDHFQFTGGRLTGGGGRVYNEFRLGAGVRAPDIATPETAEWAACGTRGIYRAAEADPAVAPTTTPQVDVIGTLGAGNYGVQYAIHTFSDRGDPIGFTLASPLDTVTIAALGDTILSDAGAPPPANATYAWYVETAPGSGIYLFVSEAGTQTTTLAAPGSGPAPVGVNGSGSSGSGHRVGVAGGDAEVGSTGDGAYAYVRGGRAGAAGGPGKSGGVDFLVGLVGTEDDESLVGRFVPDTGYLGLGTNLVAEPPVSRLDVNGTVGTGSVPTVETVDFNFDDLERGLALIDCTAGNITGTLPAAADVPRREYTAKRVDASGNTIDIAAAGGDTIDGAATYALAVQYDFVRIKSDGVATWHVVGK